MFSFHGETHIYTHLKLHSDVSGSNYEEGRTADEASMLWGDEAAERMGIWSDF